MIVWGGLDGGGAVSTGGQYTPGTDSWLATSTGGGAPTARFNHRAVWTGTELIVWGGWNGVNAPQVATYSNTGSRYTPGTDSWVETHVGLNAPSPRSGHTAVWTGTEMIVWGGGLPSHRRPLPAGDRQLAADQCRRQRAERLLLGTHGGLDGQRNDRLGWTLTLHGPWGEHRRPVFARFRQLAAHQYGGQRAAGRVRHTAVWTGSEMVVWGGAVVDGQNAFLDTGGRYTPGTDSWLATSTSGAVPSARSHHTAVWTGNEMVVFGGFGTTFVALGTGGRYVPGTNTWLPLSAGANAPDGRFAHSAVWTGAEMIVWGGLGADGGVWHHSGGRYDPTDDDWVPVSPGASVSLGRAFHTAVWTGDRMIIWGGSSEVADGLFPALYATGGRYSPVSDTWEPTSTTGVPKARTRHTAVWTGGQMLIWGGDISSPANPTNTGGLYCSPGPSGFFTLKPCRVFDSRTPGDGPAIPSGSTRIVQLAARCSVPVGAKSVSLNLTIVGASGGGFLQAYAGDQPAPGTSVVNFVAGSTRANNALVQLALGGSGTLALRPTLDNGTPLHVVVDVNGYFE